MLDFTRLSSESEVVAIAGSARDKERDRRHGTRALSRRPTRNLGGRDRVLARSRPDR